MAVQAVRTDHGGLLHGVKLRGFFSKAGVFPPAGNARRALGSKVTGSQSSGDRGRPVSSPAVGTLLLLDEVLHVLLLLPDFHQLQL